MEQYMKVNGQKTNHMVKEKLFTVMVTSMMATELMEKLLDKELIFTKMVKNI